MKTPWTRSEKLLWATPLLLGAIAFVIVCGPNVVRRVMGWPQQLDTTKDNELFEVVLSRDGSVLAASGRDYAPKSSPLTNGMIYLWDARTLRPLKPFAPQQWMGGQPPNGAVIDALSLSPDGKLIGISRRGASGYAVYQRSTQTLLWHIKTNPHHAQFSADGRFVALGKFELRDARTGKLVARWKAPNSGVVQHFALSPDAKTVAWIGARKPRVTVMNTTAQKPGFSDGKAVEIRRVSDGKVLRVLPTASKPIASRFRPTAIKFFLWHWPSSLPGSLMVAWSTATPQRESYCGSAIFASRRTRRGKGFYATPSFLPTGKRWLCAMSAQANARSS